MPTYLHVLCSTTLFVAAVATQPNVIIMQPDDMPFFDEWDPPPNTPSAPAFRDKRSNPLPPGGLPNIERLRTQGLRMTRAYSAAAMCGTSRYTTITGRYASRAASSRSHAAEISQEDVASVVIPRTKLEDVEGYGNDCSEDNVAQQFKNGGYNTKVVGKWHLSQIDRSSYTYEKAVDIVKGCGFDEVGGLYVENMSAGGGGPPGGPGSGPGFYDGSFSHNMELVTYEAVQFIKNAVDNDRTFFLYHNPTVPHSSQDVRTALTEFSCRDTPNGTLDFDPMIAGMTEEYGSCEAYRDTILERAGSDNDLGAIWVDDSVGALLVALEEKGVLDDTIFLFQEDHGVESKNTLYETGVRVPQYVHYPAKYAPGTTFDAPVSTVDIGPTVLDFAGIEPLYDMDGSSWKDVVGDCDREAYWRSERCLFFENEQDRAVMCGCDKYLELYGEDPWVSSSYARARQQGLSNNMINLFDLCNGSNRYETDPDDNMERRKGGGRRKANLAKPDRDIAVSMSDIIECHLTRTAPSIDPDFSPCGDHDDKAPESPNVIDTLAATAITTSSTTIRLRTSKAVRIMILYWPANLKKKGSRRKRTQYVKTNASDDFAVSIKLDDLIPCKKYYYFLNKDKTKRSFRTLCDENEVCSAEIE